MSGDQCNFCTSPIRWLTSAATGALMPVDAAPDPQRGNVVLIGGKAGVLGKAKAVAARRLGTELYLHHVVNCPESREWNEKQRTRPARGKATR